ncbi:MAG: ABC transporter ATP-binding protein [Clostridiales bacterium]|nr:ABC transporter ATP-binding protein [Clostridiales bacterium]
MQKGKIIRWLARTTFHFCLPYIIVSIFILISAPVLNLAINYLNKLIVNELIDNMQVGFLSNLFFALIFAYMSIYFIQQANQFLSAFGRNFYQNIVDELYRSIFMWKSYQTPQEAFLNTEFMDKYHFANASISHINSFLNRILTFVFVDIGTLLTTLGVFVVYDPWLILYVLIIAVISVFSSIYTSKMEYAVEKEQTNRERKKQYYKEILTSKSYAKELRIYRYKNNIYKRWKELANELRGEKLSIALKRIKIQNYEAAIQYAVRFLSLVFLLRGVFYHTYDVGTFVLLFGLVDACTMQTHSLVQNVMFGLCKDFNYLENYYDFVMPITDAEIHQIVKTEKTTFDSRLLFGPFQNLKIQNLYYQYPSSEKWAVKDVSFTINKGEIISILGFNGSGKTTLSKLITGALAPTKGNILINENHISSVDRSFVFPYFGMAPQEFSRFSLTIKENVGLGYIEKMDDQCYLDRAYEKAELNSFINKYSNKDETMLGKAYDENGVELSGGEWQKLILASAYMGMPEILIFDEPTASIDPLKEMEMLAHFRKNLEGKTAILISHRIGFARLADKILIMADGSIIEQGTHEELLKHNGYYANMFQKQREFYGL